MSALAQNIRFSGLFYFKKIDSKDLKENISK